jgi:hypothetical protein
MFLFMVLVFCSGSLNISVTLKLLRWLGS